MVLTDYPGVTPERWSLNKSASPAWSIARWGVPIGRSSKFKAQSSKFKVQSSKYADRHRRPFYFSAFPPQLFTPETCGEPFPAPSPWPLAPRFTTKGTPCSNPSLVIEPICRSRAVTNRAGAPSGGFGHSTSPANARRFVSPPPALPRAPCSSVRADDSANPPINWVAGRPVVPPLCLPVAQQRDSIDRRDPPPDRFPNGGRRRPSQPTPPIDRAGDRGHAGYWRP